MLETLFVWVLAMMHALAPARSPESLSPLARVIAQVATDEPALFRDDDTRVRTTSLLVAVAYRESGFDNRAVGDHGRSVCAMQILDGDKSLLEDPAACIRRALKMLRTSISVCREHPIAWYAEGPKGCASPRAQAISRDRMNLAGWARGKAAETLSLVAR
jgi:hypothetical protein